MTAPADADRRTVAEFGERALVERIASRLPMPRWVAVGPGDDAAVIAPERGTFDVLTTDVQVEGIHFDRRFVPPDAIGHRALAVNLSDLAAMGARPRAALLSLVLPDALEIGAIDGMVDGLLALASAHRVAIVGGNISRSPGPLVVDVTAIGAVRPRRVLTRRGARPGDEVYVTGTIGLGLVGLRSLQDASDVTSPGPRVGAEQTDGSAREGRLAAEAKYLRPEPRVRAGVVLGGTRTASACMDLSDGLADGVRQIAEASGTGMIIDAAALPIPDAARRWHEDRGADAVAAAMSGGDEYELLFTVRPAHRGRLRGARRSIGDLAVTRIGVVTKERRLVVRTPQGDVDLPEGFAHFGRTD